MFLKKLVNRPSRRLVLARPEFSLIQTLVLLLLIGGATPIRAQYEADEKPAPTTDTGSVTIHGRLLNGTRNSPAKVDELSLIQLSGGMQVLAQKTGVGPNFQFKGIARPKSPLMLRAVYRGETYIVLVPPAPRFWAKQHELIVYEKRKLPADARINSGILMTRTKNGLSINKIYAINNETKYTWDTSEFYIHLPPGAKNLNATLEHQSGRMPAPLKMRQTPKGFLPGKGIRPGRSALRIEFDIPGYEFTDRLHRTGDTFAKTPPLLWWRPENARPAVSGGQTKSLDTKQGKALELSFPDGGAGKMTFTMNSGDFYEAPPVTRRPGPQKKRAGGPPVEKNPIFGSGRDTLLGIVLFLVIFFAVASFIAASGFRLIRR